MTNQKVTKVTKEIINKVIDKKGRRKYFAKLDPKLQENAVFIDPNLIKKKVEFFFLCLILIGLMKM